MTQDEERQRRLRRRDGIEILLRKYGRKAARKDKVVGDLTLPGGAIRPILDGAIRPILDGAIRPILDGAIGVIRDTVETNLIGGRLNEEM